MAVCSDDLLLANVQGVAGFPGVVVASQPRDHCYLVSSQRTNSCADCVVGGSLYFVSLPFMQKFKMFPSRGDTLEHCAVSLKIHLAKVLSSGRLLKDQAGTDLPLTWKLKDRPGQISEVLDGITVAPFFLAYLLKEFPASLYKLLNCLFLESVSVKKRMNDRQTNLPGTALVLDLRLVAVAILPLLVNVAVVLKPVDDVELLLLSLSLNISPSQKNEKGGIP